MSPPTTLFRFARVRRPVVHDLMSRARKDGTLDEILTGPEAGRAAWAEKTLRDWPGLDGAEVLHFDYRALFRCDPLASDWLPGRDDLAKGAAERVAGLAKSEGLRADRKRLLRAAVALKIAERDDEAAKVGRYHQLLEQLPDLPEKPRPYAPAVLNRFDPEPRPAVDDAPDQPQTDDAEDTGASEARELADDLALLWRLRNRQVAAVRAEELARRDPMPTATVPPEPRMVQKALDEKASAAAAARDRRAEIAERMRALRERNEARAARWKALKEREADGSVGRVIDTKPEELAKHAGGMPAKDIAAAQDRVVASKLISGGQKLSFCQAYEEAVKVADAARPKAGAGLPDLGNCFKENPKLRFGDDIRLMGIAELIKVEERLIGYSEAEISYVENILAGEHRLREVKSTKEFELIEERAAQESTVTSSETRATTASNLSSEVSNEISTRFNTDVSASASGGGGGSVGVVTFEGEGSLDAGFGLGVDTSSRSETRSEFTNEIVDTSAEKVTKASQTRRVNRTRSLFETLNRHEIDNTGGDPPQHRRGVYCFLNQHVCVTETPYGLRWFLKATVKLPGRNLICDRLARIALALGEIDRPPEFNITPADIHPSNYLELAGRYKAQGLAPPPPPTQRMGRTYKTDQTNETDTKAEGLEAIGQAMMPVFKAYKRHLVTDTLVIPEGYKVQEVRLAISHGANGVSVPVDMPLKLTTAGMLMVPALYAWTYLIPMAMWNVLLVASPILHHNTDSSSVTATVGTESQESHYYFFEADFLITELLQMFGSFAALGPDLMAQIEEMAADLPELLNQEAADMAGAMNDAVSGVVSAVQTVFSAIQTQLEAATDLANLDMPALMQGIIDALAAFATSAGGSLGTIPSTLFEPFNTFLLDVIALISDAAQSAMSDLLAALVSASENNQALAFGESSGLTGELPVSLNLISIKPGITVNLVACLLRTDEALDAWRLDVFGTLYQSYLQLVAEYESKRFLGAAPHGKSPGTMREEERRSLREILVYTLNGVKDPPNPQNIYTFDRINLFEHAIDWNNISYRLYNYGPSAREILRDHHGVFHGADKRRRAFLTAHWAQVMLPLSPEPALEQAMLSYFDTGATEIGAGLTNDELASLWADVIAGRDRMAEEPEPISKRELVLPTDHVVLRLDDSLPHDDTTPCAP